MYYILIQGFHMGMKVPSAYLSLVTCFALCTNAVSVLQNEKGLPDWYMLHKRLWVLSQTILGSWTANKKHEEKKETWLLEDT